MWQSFGGANLGELLGSLLFLCSTRSGRRLDAAMACTSEKIYTTAHYLSF